MRKTKCLMNLTDCLKEINRNDRTEHEGAVCQRARKHLAGAACCDWRCHATPDASDTRLCQTVPQRTRLCAHAQRNLASGLWELNQLRECAADGTSAHRAGVSCERREG